MAVEFTDQNKPKCNPENGNDCTINNEAVVDIWNALKCLSLHDFVVGSKCFTFPGVVNEDTFLITKSELPGLPGSCDITFEWNGVVSYSNGTFPDDPRNYTLTEEETAYKFTLNAPVGTEDNPCDIYIKIEIKKKGIDILNSCETEGCE